MKALYWHPLDRGLIKCDLCPHNCILKPGERGQCRGRSNVDGEMRVDNYAKSVGINIDKIEKKPLYHYKPGSKIVSLGPNSCNMSCSFCQNASISQQDQICDYLETWELRAIIERSGYMHVAFTYTEPLTWYEYIIDFAASNQDIDVILITNGYLNPAPFDDLLKHVRALNIDLKSMNPQFYYDQCGAQLEPVLKNIAVAFNRGIHLEVSNLVIPDLNDSEHDLDSLVDYLFNLSPQIPLHFSAYHPAFKLKVRPTTLHAILDACNRAAQRMNYVYAGNINHSGFQNTICPVCKSAVISRKPGKIEVNLDKDSTCPSCGELIIGVFV